MPIVLFYILFASLAALVVVRGLLLGRIRSKYPDTYRSLGSPDLQFPGKLFAFIKREGQYRWLNDGLVNAYVVAHYFLVAAIGVLIVAEFLLSAANGGR